MTERSFPYDEGQGVTGATYERLMSGMAGNGRVGPSFGEVLSITPLVYADSTGRQCKIAVNSAYHMRGYRWENHTEPLVVPLEANTTGKPRIDRIVMRLDRDTDYFLRIAVLKGTPADAPIPPSVTIGVGEDGVYEEPLARVTVKSQAGTGLPSIAAADVVQESKYLMPLGHVGLAQWRGNNALGKAYLEQDTDRLYWGTAGGDILVGEQSAWTKVDVAGGWKLDNVYAQRVNGWTYLQASLTLDTDSDKAANSTLRVMELDSYLRPLHDVLLSQVWLSPGQAAAGRIDAGTGFVDINLFPQTFPKGGKAIIGPISYPSKGIRG